MCDIPFGHPSTTGPIEGIKAVLLIVQEHLFDTIVRNWTFREARFKLILRKICIFIFNWLKKWYLMPKHSKESSLNGLLSNIKWMLIFQTKSFSAMRLTFIFKIVRKIQLVRHKKLLVVAITACYEYRRYVIPTRWLCMPYNQGNSSITAWIMAC